MVSIKPKKSLGQNFLKDSNIIRKIVSAFEVSEGDYVLEIGPGMGALTDELVKLNINLTLIEIDKRAIEILEKKFNKSKYPNINILNEDITNFSIADFIKNNNINKKIYVIGNIPYNLTSEIFFMLLNDSDYINKAQLMIQKDVALRFTAKPRTKAYGILTVAADLKAVTKILFDVSPTCFYPIPNVTSSVIQIEFNNSNQAEVDFSSIMKLIRAAFNQRRKTLRNALNEYVNKELSISIDEFSNWFIEKYSLNLFSKRAEELTKDDFLVLYKAINERKVKKYI